MIEAASQVPKGDDSNLADKAGLEKPAVIEEKSPSPATTAPISESQVPAPELAVVKSKKKDRSHRKTASNLPPSPKPAEQTMTKSRSSTVSVVNVNQAAEEDQAKIPAELAHLSPRGKKDKEKRSSKRISKNLSKEKEKKEKKKREKKKASSDSLKKSLSDAKGLDQKKEKKSSTKDKGILIVQI